MIEQKNGLLAKSYCGKNLPLSVCKNGAGNYYIGTEDHDGPCSRESVEYWRSQEAAQQALQTGAWTQRQNP